MKKIAFLLLSVVCTTFSLRATTKKKKRQYPNFRQLTLCNRLWRKRQGNGGYDDDNE